MTKIDLELSKSVTELSDEFQEDCVNYSMIGWHHFPYIRILIPFVLGIALALNLNKHLLWLPIVVVLLILLYAILILVFMKRVAFQFRWVSGLLAFLTLLLSGYLTADINRKKYQPETSHAGIEGYHMVWLLTDPVEKAASFRLTVSLEASFDTTWYFFRKRKVLLYLEKTDGIQALRYGDRLFIKANIQPLSPPLNPGEFDYPAYLATSGIYMQGFVRADNWKKLGGTKGNPLLKWSKNIRRKMLAVLTASGVGGDEFAVASAILLGFDGYLDPEQKRQFSGAGAMHILCVSGLHVGIIAAVLNSLLIFMNRNRMLIRIKVMILIVLIWVYAAVTGFSPSVMRAATMFSFIYFGSSVKKNINSYNMLAASAFLLLLIDPYFLTTIGFQLSYLAVGGILLLFKPIYNLFLSDSWLLDKIWQISVVSIAATLFTSSVSLYYFNQFPNLFLITNLVAIPASFLIVYTGIALLSLSFIPLVSEFMAQILTVLLMGLNKAVAFVEGLPFATSRGIHLSPAELVLLLGITSSLAVLVVNRSRKSVLALIVLAIMLTSVNAIRQYQHLNQEVFTVYAIRGHTALGMVHGKEAVVMCDSALLLAPEKINYAISGHHLELGIKKVRFYWMGIDSIETNWLMKKGPFIYFAGEKTMLLDLDDAPVNNCHIRGFDQLIVSKRTGITPEFIVHASKQNLIVIDSSVSLWLRKEWIEACKAEKVDFQDIQSGAFVYSLAENRME